MGAWLRAAAAAGLVLSFAAPLASGQSVGIPPRWILLYGAAPAGHAAFPRYTVDDLARLVAVLDTAGRPRAWLTTGAIFLALYAPSANVFTNWIGGPPATGADWRAYADTLLAPGGPVARLDSVVGLVAGAVAPLATRYQVAIMIPYPDPRVEAIRYGGRTYGLAEPSSGAALVAAYVADVATAFARRGFQHVALDAFYWLHEEIGGRDNRVVPTVAAQVHQAGFHFLWIPYYDAPGWSRWRRYGFDDAWLQPNYFFDVSLPTPRLDSAVARARAAGMGMELEFDGRLLDAPAYSDRLFPYLGRLAAAPDLLDRSVAIFEGAGALVRLSRSKDPWHRAIYHRLTQVLGAASPPR